MCGSGWGGNRHARRKRQTEGRRKKLQKLKDVEFKSPCFHMRNGHTVCSEPHLAAASRSSSTTTFFPPSSLNMCSRWKTNKQTKASCSLICKALLGCWLGIRGFYLAKLCPTELHFISISTGKVINSLTENSGWTAFRIWSIFWITECPLACGIVLKSVCGYIYYNSFFSACLNSERGEVDWCNLIKPQCKRRDCQEISYV